MVDSARTNEPAPRNILFVTMHDTQPILGGYAEHGAHTPHMDAFAKTAVRFERAYCQSPQCGPSRASFLSGRYPERNGVAHNADPGMPPCWERVRLLDPTTVMLPEHLKSHGWTTWILGDLGYRGCNEDGRAWSVSGREAPGDRLLQTPQGMITLPNDHRNPVTRQQMISKTLEALRHGAQPGTYAMKLAGSGPMIEIAEADADDYSDGRRTSAAINALASLGPAAAAGTPFFLGVGYKAGHTPFLAPRWAWDANPIESMPPPMPAHANTDSNDPGLERTCREHPTFAEGEAMGDEPFRPGLGDQTMRSRRACCAALTLVDHYLGRLLAALEEQGLADSTIVIITGDHGMHVGERRRWGKTSLFDLDCRVPLWIRVPGQATGVCHGIVELLDLYPTLCELLDLSTPAQCEGQSLRPVLVDPMRFHKPLSFTSFGQRAAEGAPLIPSQSVTDERYRLSRFPQADGSWLLDLYDHAVDPHETSNQADDPAYAEVRERLFAALEAHSAQSQAFGAE